MLVVAQIGRAFQVHIFPLRRFHEIIFIIPEMLPEQPPQESMPVFVFAVTPDRLRTGILQPFSKAVWQGCHHISYLVAKYLHLFRHLSTNFYRYAAILKKLA